MIKYRLKCSQAHEFEGWFQSSIAFDEQAAQRAVSCPVCADDQIEKAIMAPSLCMKRAGSQHAPREATPHTVAFDPAAPRDINAVRQAIRAFRDHLARSAQYVGPRFPEEVRRMHEEDEPDRRVWGEATVHEVEDLLEEGFPVLPVPALPEELD